MLEVKCKKFLGYLSKALYRVVNPLLLIPDLLISSKHSTYI